MKRITLSLLLAICWASGSSQYKFTLDIRSITLSDKKIFLNLFNNHNFVPIKIDSFTVKDGHHIYNGEVDQPSNLAAFYITYKGKIVEKSFVIDSGTNKISIELPAGNSRYLTLKSDARGEFVFNDLNNLFEETIAHYKKPTRVNGYLKIPEDLDKEITQLQLKRLEHYPNDYSSLLYLYRISHTDLDSYSAKNNLVTLATFSDKVKNTPLGKLLYDEETSLINNKIIVGAGKPVKTFAVTDINNKLFSNSSLNGQPYLIVFSATWCGPCQLELPKLKKLYAKYKPQGLKVIYFNNDDDVTRWQNHVKANQLTWINVSERLKPAVSKIQKSFGVYAVPSCILVDKQGIIAYNSDESDVGLEKIESYIKRVTSIN